MNSPRIANTFFTRIKGRIGETTASQPLLIPRCNAVHTFGMKFPLRLTWLDRAGKIIREDTIKPGKFCACLKAHSVLESHLDEPHNLFKNQSGQALVEAAFTIPILLVIVFGFIQIGLAVHQNQKLTYVTHYAAQVGAITNDPQKITGAIETFFNPDEYTISIESRDENQNPIADSTRQHNDILTIAVRHPFSLQIPLVSLSVLELRAQASAPVLCNNLNPPFICNS